jgi:NIMA-interacting peptidyl-prolyl cis-trans isomerase 1
MTKLIKTRTFSLVNGIVQSGHIDGEEEIEVDMSPSPSPSIRHHQHEHLQNHQEAKKIRCSHILIKHKDSLRPVLWKNNAKITRTPKEAQQLIELFREKIIEEAIRSPSYSRYLVLQGTFDKIAQKYSECPSGQSGGDLNFFTVGQMQYSFEQSSFALKVGALSEPVWTDSGCHLILRTA